MTSPYFDHPSEDSLERFLLHHSQDDELDRVETHIMGCDSCVARLEQLELQMAAVRLALSELSLEPKAVPARQSLQRWFSFRTISWAGAVAALALMVSLVPGFLSRPSPAVDVNLFANRGSGITTAPHGRPLSLHLRAEAIQNGPVQAVLVDGNGSELWNGTAQVRNDQVEIHIPKVVNPGMHFLRLYSLTAGNVPGDLLREYPFEVD